MGLLDFFKKGEKIETTQPADGSLNDFFKTNQPAPSPMAPVAEEVEEPAVQTYEIQSGDSLSKIAKKFYGQANDWNKIYEANKDVIKDPNMIYPGQKIVIPA